MPNNLFIISGPSGSGQDSIIQGLAKIMPIERVITTTTRPMREGESQGNPYYFMSKADFAKAITENKFFEYAVQYNGQYYGVTFEEIERVQNSPYTGIWKIDFQGVATAKKLLPGIKAILINAPLDILEKRIRERSIVSDKFVAERMEYTKKWLTHKDLYDFEVENKQGKLDLAINQVANLIKSESVKASNNQI